MNVAARKEVIGCGLIVVTDITGLLIVCGHVIQRAIKEFYVP
jgi:hypothetical protein